MAAVISVVDDDKAVRDALRRMLNAHGFTVNAFASAEQFLSWSERQEPACLILDVRMPGMSGLSLHRRLLSKGCRIPTILVTACPTDGERQRAIAAGAVSYLAKPFSEEVLLDTLRDALSAKHRLPEQG
jgi:FixJ family two-component response regulator